MKIIAQRWSGNNRAGALVVMLLLLLVVLAIATSFMTGQNEGRKDEQSKTKAAINDNVTNKVVIAQVGERARFTKAVMLVGFPLTFVLAYALGLSKGIHIRKGLSRV